MPNILFPELTTASSFAAQQQSTARHAGDQDGPQLSFADFLRMMGALPSLEVTAAETSTVAAAAEQAPRAINIEGLQTSQSAMFLEDGFRELLGIAFNEQSAVESTATLDPIFNSPYMAKLFSDANPDEVRLIPIPVSTFTEGAVLEDGPDALAPVGLQEKSEIAQPTGAYQAFLTGEAKTETWAQFRLSAPDVDPLLFGRNPYLVEQLSDPIVNWAQLSKNGEQTEFHVRLDPPELGPVRLVINTADDAISVQLVTATDATRDVMQSHLADLVQALESAGLSLEECDVTCDESFANADAPLPVDDADLRSDYALAESFREFLINPDVLNADRVDIVI